MPSLPECPYPYPQNLWMQCVVTLHDTTVFADVMDVAHFETGEIILSYLGGPDIIIILKSRELSQVAVRWRYDDGRMREMHEADFEDGHEPRNAGSL